MYQRSSRYRKKPKRSRRFKIAAVLAVTVVLAVGLARAVDAPTDSNFKTPAAFNKSRHSVDNPSSLWAVVNKGRALPSDYAPADLKTPNVPLRLSAASSEMTLRADAAMALEQLFAGASKEKLPLMLASAYRSFEQQDGLYNLYVRRDGKARADASSARPGHSEHQTGLAADVEPASRECELQICFGDLPEGRWVANNAHKYGFVISYQKGNKSLTGYEYEPWHLRYVGKELAAQLHSSNQTMEQFFGLPAFIDYPAQPTVLKP